MITCLSEPKKHCQVVQDEAENSDSDCDLGRNLLLALNFTVILHVYLWNVLDDIIVDFALKHNNDRILLI